MATIITGRKLAIKIGSSTYSSQTADVTLTPNNNTETYQTLTGATSVKLPTTWELTIRAFQDWNDAASFARAMWTAAAAGTSVTFELKVDSGDKFTGSLVPVYPNVGGAADAALEMDLTFTVNGDVTFTPGA